MEQTRLFADFSCICSYKPFILVATSPYKYGYAFDLSSFHLVDFIKKYPDTYQQCLLDELPRSKFVDGVGYIGCISLQDILILAVYDYTSDLAMNRVCRLMSYCLKVDPALNFKF